MQKSYDPFSVEVLDDPASASAWLLSECPVHRFDGFDPPFWTLSRYEDVQSALKDTSTFSSRYGQHLRYMEERGLRSDAPMHTSFRALVRKAFTPRAVAAMEPRIERIVADLIDAFVACNKADLHDDFAYPLPTIVIAEMLGVPVADRPQFKVWSDAWLAAMASPDPDVYADELAHMREYLLDQVVYRQRREAAGQPSRGDLISELVLAEEDGARLGAEDVVNVVRQLLVAGNETTTSLITNALVRLIERPGLLERLRSDPRLIDVVIEESLRYDSPVLGLFRTTTRPVNRHGTVIPADVKVMLHYGAANRDPAMFEEPDVFSLDRDIRKVRNHLAFGYGVHVCLGAALARLEARIALSQLVERLPGLQITAPPERIAPFMLWGRETLPVRWSFPG